MRHIIEDYRSSARFAGLPAVAEGSETPMAASVCKAARPTPPAAACTRTLQRIAHLILAGENILEMPFAIATRSFAFVLLRCP